jgi:murein DD-endopeptidase MepM/ murein hydrolase activator NlpD
MRVICLSEDGAKKASFDLNPWTHLIIPALFVALLIGGLSINQILGLYKLDQTAQYNQLSEAETKKILSSLEQQIETVHEIKEKYSYYTVDVAALTKKLGALEAEAMRLRALGNRIVAMAKLDPKEFSFELDPGRGGADDETISLLELPSANELQKSVEHLDYIFSNEKELMTGMVNIIQGQILDQEVKPSANPVAHGYMSSSFGFRRDPFNGRRKLHKGIDFAGPIGTEIFSVAAGVVSFVGRKGGYGNVVEVDHGEGLVSRYAHLSKALVQKGEIVKKGALVAEMGSTGRSTGSHLHLEVLDNGEPRDPADFLANSLKKNN